MSPHILLSAGSNAQGQLATGDTEDAHSFSPCLFLDCQPQPAGTLPTGTSRVLNIACGANHTLLLLERTSDSSTSLRTELWGSGDGSKGQLGSNVTTSTQTFRPLDLDLAALGLGDDARREYTIVQIAACWETSYVVLRSTQPQVSDVLLSMGSDDFGDLGVGGAKALGKKTLDGVYVVNLLSSESIVHSGPVTVKSITTGPHHVLVLLSFPTKSGETVERLVGWGSSRHGQLGTWKDPRTGKPIPFLPSPQLVPLPHIQENDSIRQIAAGTHHTVILYASGRVSALGSNRKGQLTAVADVADVTDIGCTWNGTYAITKRGGSWTVLSTGNHTKGQLGRQVHGDGSHVHAMADVHFPLSHDAHELVKVACGSEHILSLIKARIITGQPSQSEVWGWGWNEHGNLGLGHTKDQNIPIKLYPPVEETGQPHTPIDIWAGCGTSWVLLAV